MSNNKVRTLIFVKKKCALSWDAYLNGCVFKQEITELQLEMPMEGVKIGLCDQPLKELFD